MDIIFTLQSTTDGALMTGQAANVTVYLSIDGAAFSASTNAAQEIGHGAYKVALTNAEAAYTRLLYNPVCTGAQSNIYQLDVDTTPTAAQNAAAVWDAQDKIVAINTTQAATLATAAALTTVGNNVSAVKAKTDNLPASPAAAGDAMTLTSAYDAAKTASQFNAATDAVTIDSEQAATLATAQALAAQSGLLDVVAASILHWAATASTLTLYDNNGAAIGVYDLTRDSSGNITAIEPHVEG